jgi:predicted ATPase
VVLDAADTDELFVDVMNELVGKSLLSVSVEDGAVVYRLLETTRLYALDRLTESGELDPVSIRHARFFADHPARGADLGNVRAALKSSFSFSTGHTTGVRLAATAARMLLERGLVSECQSWCRQALDVIATPASGSTVELELQEAFAITTMFLRGNGDDVRRAVTRGVELARAVGDGDDEVRLLGHLNSFLVRRGEFKESLEIAERSIKPARAPSNVGQIRAEWMVVFSHHLCGHQTDAEGHAEEALRLEATASASSTRRGDSVYNHPHRPTMARTLWLRGRTHHALDLARSIVAGVSGLKHPFERSSALILSEGIFIWSGEWPDAERIVDTISELVTRYSLASQRGTAMGLRGELLVRTGRPQEGCKLLRNAVALLKVERNSSFVTVYLAALAEALAATGSLSEAIHTIEEAITDADERGGTFDLPELKRIKAVMLASRSPTDTRVVEQTLTSAIELARKQGALAWELRATTTLARERLRRGATDALNDLAVVHAKFTDGKDTPDLAAARQLLAERRLDQASGRSK